MKTIQIIVSPKGESRVETNGFNGSSCQNASRFIEQALGKQASEKLKPEFYAQTQTEASLENKN